MVRAEQVIGSLLATLLYYYGEKQGRELSEIKKLLAERDYREVLNEILDELAKVTREVATAPKVVTVFIENGLDKAVTVQLKANRIQDYAGSVSVGSAFTVPANTNDARTLTPETSGWLPFLTVEVKCDTIPTSGSLTVYSIRSRDDQARIVDALEIRDTSVHNPATDPERIRVVEW